MATVFLTSLPRSGSTWAAEAIAAATASRYIHEPFNLTVRPAGAPFYMKYMRRGACDAGFVRMLKQSVRLPTARLRLRELVLGRRVVVKDVHCCLAVECVQRHLRAAVIIMVRHPCAMASSWARLDFRRSVDALLQQPVLMEEHLAPFAAHLQSSTDRYFEIGAFWGASYHVLQRMAAGHPEWQWVSHEDLCLDPERSFRGLLQRAGAQIRAEPGRFLAEHDRPPAADEDSYAIFRDSRLEVRKWERLLSQEQIRSVLRGAEPFDVETLLRSRL